MKPDQETWAIQNLLPLGIYYNASRRQHLVNFGRHGHLLMSDDLPARARSQRVRDVAAKILPNMAPEEVVELLRSRTPGDVAAAVQAAIGSTLSVQASNDSTEKS